MPSLTGILAVAAAVMFLGAIGMGYLYTGAVARNGKLEAALNTATTRLKEINNVQKEADAIHGTNRALPDDKLFDGLLK